MSFSGKYCRSTFEIPNGHLTCHTNLWFMRFDQKHTGQTVVFLLLCRRRRRRPSGTELKQEKWPPSSCGSLILSDCLCGINHVISNEVAAVYTCHHQAMVNGRLWNILFHKSSVWNIARARIPFFECKFILFLSYFRTQEKRLNSCRQP